MLRKISKDILGILVMALCFTGMGIKDGNYELTSYAATSDWSNHWAKNQIQQFIEKGHIGGYSDGTFKPNNSITRAEFITIFNKAFELTTTSGKVFNDTKTHWAKNEIDKAVTNGVCNGKTATEFKPNDPITREEAAVMIANYKKGTDSSYDKIYTYYDGGQISSWAISSVEGLIEKGYIGGYSDDTFRPKGKITRAEAVVTIDRVVSNIPLPPRTAPFVIPQPGPVADKLVGNVTKNLGNNFHYYDPNQFYLRCQDLGDVIEIYVDYEIFSLSEEGLKNIQTIITHYLGNDAWIWVYDRVIVNPKDGDEQKTFNGKLIKMDVGTVTVIEIEK